ncbi:rCG63687 [Rattus norvegicus]|uniref:RCG63687 n=1 Tax=Rattus norvegicus TaxID=10116 RepID=A6HRP3_RAT|nr:rCG63687 [Rattus norvegicus]
MKDVLGQTTLTDVLCPCLKTISLTQLLSSATDPSPPHLHQKHHCLKIDLLWVLANKSDCHIWSLSPDTACPWEARMDCEHLGLLKAKKTASALSKRLCNSMLLSGLTRRPLLALDPSARFNSRSSQGPPAA